MIQADGRRAGATLTAEDLDPAEFRWHIERALDARAVHDRESDEPDVDDGPGDGTGPATTRWPCCCAPGWVSFPSRRARRPRTAATIGPQRWRCWRNSPSRRDRSRPGARLASRALSPKLPVRYLYDFGDNWEHDIVVEKLLDRQTVAYPRCTGGRRAAQPDDCGGIWGATPNSSRSSVTPPTQNTKNGWNCSATNQATTSTQPDSTPPR
jgi:hypothetical protein